MYYFVNGELMHCDDELYHHGILGMKWGRRRYQKENGSYTEAGENRREKRPWFKRLSKGGDDKGTSEKSKKSKKSRGKSVVDKIKSNPKKALLVGAGVTAGAIYLNRLNNKKARDFLAKEIYKNAKTMAKVGKTVGSVGVKTVKKSGKIAVKATKGGVNYTRRYIRGMRRAL